MKRICIITTMWSSINNWIMPFFDEYHKRNIDVTIICNMDKEFERNLKKEFPYINTYAVKFPRGIDVTGSFKSIKELYTFFKKNKFDMVQYSTPNASMYAAVAAWLNRVPARLYCQWGMVYITMTGFKRMLFRSIEKLVCRLSTEIQPDSTGNLFFCRNHGFYNENKSRVIWNGSAKGLDLTEFDISKKEEYSSEIRDRYCIEKDAPVVGFVGRLGAEKGCNELFKAFHKIKQEFAKAKLLFVGPIEKEDTIKPEWLSYFKNCEDIIKTDRVSDVVKHISAMDVFVLPSYREGFGMSVIEASAMQVPVVVTKYPGPSCGMKEGVTGYSVKIKDVEDLVDKISKLLTDKELSNKMGKAGREYVIKNFDRNIFTEKYMENRMSLINGVKE